MKIVAQRLKELRLENNYTQSDVAEYLKIDRSNYSKYERGLLEVNIYMLRALCDFYNVTADYLLGRTDDYSIKG